MTALVDEADGIGFEDVEEAEDEEGEPPGRQGHGHADEADEHAHHLVDHHQAGIGAVEDLLRRTGGAHAEPEEAGQHQGIGDRRHIEIDQQELDGEGKQGAPGAGSNGQVAEAQAAGDEHQHFIHGSVPWG